MISFIRELAESMSGPLAAVVGIFLFMHVKEDKKERHIMRKETVDVKYMDLFKEEHNRRFDTIEKKLDAMGN